MTNIFQQVAERNGTTVQDVRDEITRALRLAGIKEDPETVIRSIVSQIKECSNHHDK